LAPVAREHPLGSRLARLGAARVARSGHHAAGRQGNGCERRDSDLQLHGSPTSLSTQRSSILIRSRVNGWSTCWRPLRMSASPSPPLSPPSHPQPGPPRQPGPHGLPRPVKDRWSRGRLGWIGVCPGSPFPHHIYLRETVSMPRPRQLLRRRAGVVLAPAGIDHRECEICKKLPALWSRRDGIHVIFMHEQMATCVSVCLSVSPGCAGTSTHNLIPQLTPDFASPRSPSVTFLLPVSATPAAIQGELP